MRRLYTATPILLSPRDLTANPHPWIAAMHRECEGAMYLAADFHDCPAVAHYDHAARELARLDHERNRAC